jgi:hypothetical protein
MAGSDPEGMEEGSSGSWLPLVVIFTLLFFRWAAYGQGNVPIRMRRWYNLQVRMRKIERRPLSLPVSSHRIETSTHNFLLHLKYLKNKF